MSPLSSSTLFHFTSSRENLISILATEFSPRFSFEEFTGAIGEGSGTAEFAVGIPMVCFCDIPLSLAADHMMVYGRYALGLTKDWGRRLGVAPVLYTYPEAATTDAVIRLHLTIEVLRGTADDGAEFSADTERLICFVKPYEGTLRRIGHQEKRVRFYDEREWRYVPPGPWTALERQSFDDPGVRATANEEIGRRSRLRFEPADIRYIVVATESEIGPMVSEIRRIKSPKYSSADIDLLCTRIVSARQIAEDF